MKAAILALLAFYKKILSPVLERVFGHACIYTPTCSDYTAQAVEKFGILRGTFLGGKRILKCNPFFNGGYDPVPEK